MPIDGSPKKYAEDVSNGLIIISQPVLKRFAPHEIKIVYSNLQIVLREVRAEFVEPSEFDKVKHKNIRMQKINQALLIIANHCRVNKIPL